MAFDEQPLSLEQYRQYLRLLFERLRLKPSLQAKFDVEDLVQETLLKAQRSLKQFRGKNAAAFKAWLKKIAERVAVDKARQFEGPQRNVKLEQELRKGLDESAAQLENWLPAPDESPSQQAIKHEEADQLDQALTQLPPDQQQAVRLRILEGCSLEDISRQMGRSTDAVGALFRRGLKKLRNLLDGLQ
jgi:RNA polymerase sigma-70 factor (ECF subfamily)